MTAATKKDKPRLTKKDRAILNALPEDYRRALLYYHQACVADDLEHGNKPMPLAALVQKLIYDFLAEAQQRDPAARTAFEILIAPQFIASLKAGYEAWADAGKPGVANGR